MQEVRSYSRGYIPHLEVPGAVQFVTFRLADSLPAERRHEWEILVQREKDPEIHRAYTHTSIVVAGIVGWRTQESLTWLPTPFDFSTVSATDCTDTS